MLKCLVAGGNMRRNAQIPDILNLGSEGPHHVKLNTDCLIWLDVSQSNFKDRRLTFREIGQHHSLPFLFGHFIFMFGSLFFFDNSNYFCVLIKSSYSRNAEIGVSRNRIMDF